MLADEVICPLCGSTVEREKFQIHFDLEKYVLNTIEERHPEWKEADGGCSKCLEYYINIPDR